ncbi:DNA starvation/stationary phase protection protein [Breoghania sp.]|uniref:Dps family protein n=1 Tax=Breoghania sp. TaxID=2065378 RepID=UPI0029CA45C1|nr:DNA starvation/stationary phase protection protein [Breoghania sp.]
MASSAASVLKPVAHEEKLNTGLDERYCAEMSEMLSQILVSTYQLTIKSQIYHWNVVGPLFKSLHELTEDHYNALFGSADIIAERIRALGHLAPATIGEISGFSPTGNDVDHGSAINMVKDLVADHEAAVRVMRKAGVKADEAGDLVTADMLTARMTFHEKALWMLRAIITQ